MLMDAIQRCLMFEDRDETARQGRAVAEWLRIPPGGGGPVVVLSSHCEGILDFSSRRGRHNNSDKVLIAIAVWPTWVAVAVSENLRKVLIAIAVWPTWIAVAVSETLRKVCLA
uniref:Uncharacterized protein n=1 Tax=Fagus sylvatica TaxID=28930 RepID=A0A2N9F861_FAGSY